MKIMKKIMIPVIAAAAVIAACMTSFAAKAEEEPVNVNWKNMQLDASGYISWSIELPEEAKGLSVKNYEVVMDIMTTGSWRENYRKFTSLEDSRDISFSIVGLYRFRVRANFVGGLRSTWSEYSDICTVTSDYVKKEEPGGSGSGSAIGPGVIPGGYQAGGFSGPGTALIPAWVEKTGFWQYVDGSWFYTINGQVIRDRWACVYNEYAKTGAGQRCYDWFCFDESGRLRTGWYVDVNGSIFYLNPVADGTRGRMFTGWNLIDGYYYYFSTAEGSGMMGALFRNTVTPDGYRVDDAGRRVF